MKRIRKWLAVALAITVAVTALALVGLAEDSITQSGEGEAGGASAEDRIEIIAELDDPLSPVDGDGHSLPTDGEEGDDGGDPERLGEGGGEDDVDGEDGEAELDAEGDPRGADGEIDYTTLSVKLRLIRSDVLPIGDCFYIKAALGGFEGLGYDARWQFDARGGEGWTDAANGEWDCEVSDDGLTLRVASTAENLNFAWRIIVTPYKQLGGD